jgi:hypothetical protein
MKRINVKSYAEIYGFSFGPSGVEGVYSVEIIPGRHRDITNISEFTIGYVSRSPYGGWQDAKTERKLGKTRDDAASIIYINWANARQRATA